jgi:hypothetical protein
MVQPKLGFNFLDQLPDPFDGKGRESVGHSTPQ